MNYENPLEYIESRRSGSPVTTGSIMGIVSDVNDILISVPIPGNIQVGDRVRFVFSYRVDQAIRIPLPTGGAVYQFPLGAIDNTFNVEIKGITWSAGDGISLTVADQNTNLGDVFAIGSANRPLPQFPGALSNDRNGFSFAFIGRNPLIFDLLESSALPTSASDLNFTSIFQLGCCVDAGLSTASEDLTQVWGLSFQLDLNTFELSTN